MTKSIVCSAVLCMALGSFPMNGAATEEYGPRTRFAGVVLKHPFLAETEEIRTEAAGHQVRVHGRLLRDSQGRVRREVSLSEAGGGSELLLIWIVDPSSGTLFALNPETKSAVAFRIEGDNQAPGWMFPGRASWPGTSSEVIENLPCRVIPIGTGSDATVSGTVWISEEMMQVIKEDLVQKGVASKWRLLNLRTQEPPAELFSVPSDYTVIESR